MNVIMFSDMESRSYSHAGMIPARPHGMFEDTAGTVPQSIPHWIDFFGLAGFSFNASLHHLSKSLPGNWNVSTAAQLGSPCP